jgi:hypothetical protein
MAEVRFAGLHLYWLVYLYWIGAVPALLVLGRVLLRTVAGLFASTDSSAAHTAPVSGADGDP